MPDVTGNEVVVVPGVCAGYRCQTCKVIRPFHMEHCPICGPDTPVLSPPPPTRAERTLLWLFKTHKRSIGLTLVVYYLIGLVVARVWLSTLTIVVSGVIAGLFAIYVVFLSLYDMKAIEERFKREVRCR